MADLDQDAKITQVETQPDLASVGKSLDGNDIIRDVTVAVNFNDRKNVLARPYVMKESDRFKVWSSAKLRPIFSEICIIGGWYYLAEAGHCPPIFGPDDQYQ